MRSRRAILILAGGAGTRLWPLSTDANPKQFLQIFDGESLLQKTFRRLSPLVDSGRIFVSTSDRYRARVTEQLPSLPEANVLVETARRNTAPAIAVCCEAIAALDPDVTIAIFPSDHAVGDEPVFAGTVERAFRFATSNEVLMTIGLRPTEPNTGFGYLEMGEELEPGIVRVKRFIEKPNVERAIELVDSGSYAWNGGMFVWRASVFRSALALFAPEIAEMSPRYLAAGEAEARSIYERMPSISIDYAVMEKAPNVASVWGEFEWSDVGSWKAVARLSAGAGNAVLEGTSNVFVRADAGRPVVIAGVSNIAVIDSPNGLAVVDLDRAELLSIAVKRLNE